MNPESVFLIILFVWLFLAGAILLPLLRIWLRCFLSGSRVRFSELIAMRLRKSPIERIADTYIRMKDNGIDVNMLELEKIFLCDPEAFDSYVANLIAECQNRIGGQGEGENGEHFGAGVPRR